MAFLGRRRRSLVCFAFVFSLLFESTFQQPQPQPLSSRTDRAALLELRSELGLRAKEWPIKADPCTVWRGVECSNGRVVGLNVSGFRRTRIGSRDPKFSVTALVNLTLLASFNASNFALPGPIPDWLGQALSSLQVLDLSSCSINGSIPVTLGNLTNLTGLYLSDNALSGIIPSSLGQLSSLSALNLSQNSLTGSIPSSFASLKNLSLLDISSNLLIGSIPPSFGLLSKLQFMNLSSNNLSSTIPPQLGDLAGLIDLDLSFNSLSGPLPMELRGLRSLKRLVIGDNLLGGSLPDGLWSLPGLSVLDVSVNNFTGLLPNFTFNADPTSAVLNISQNLFYGSLTPVLRRFGSSDLSGNYFQGKIPVYAVNNAFLGDNCLQNVSEQRTSRECALFYTVRGLVFDNFGLQNSTPTPAPKASKRRNRKWIIIGLVLGGCLLIVLLASMVCLFLFCARKKDTTNQRVVEVGATPAGPGPAQLINFSNLGDVFTYQQLVHATSDFSDANLIKHGHSGTLFRGVLENGSLVVIKKIDLQSNKKEAHLLELDFFSKVSHPRIVPLLGHCLENEDAKFLVYKYMPNEDLSRSLFKQTSLDDDSLQSLDWITRLKIAIGAAEGLSYLHHECTPPLVHRDVQASSILLDDKFEVRLGSLSEVCTQEGDTHQSMITRLLRLPQSSEPGPSGLQTATCAYDVYCFGKVLLELVTGKIGISTSSDTQTKEWLEQILPYISIYDKELVTKIVDPSLIVDEDLLEEVWAMAIVGRSCLNPRPTRRPLMRYILKALENPLKVVREESSSSGRLRTASSRGSWNAATLFGSWRLNSSDVAGAPAGNAGKLEGGGSLKHSGTTGSTGSAQIGRGDNSSSRRRQSKEICPEPSDEADLEKL